MSHSCTLYNDMASLRVGARVEKGDFSRISPSFMEISLKLLSLVAYIIIIILDNNFIPAK